MKKFINSIWEWILAIVGIVLVVVIILFVLIAYAIAYVLSFALPIAGGVVIAYFIIKLIGG